MSVRMGYENVRMLNKIMTKLINHGITLDDFEQASSVFRILKMVDEVRIHQTKVSKAYAKTAKRLRRFRQQQNDIVADPEELFSWFVGAVNEELGITEEVQQQSELQSSSRSVIK